MTQPGGSELRPATSTLEGHRTAAHQETLLNAPNPPEPRRAFWRASTATCTPFDVREPSSEGSINITENEEEDVLTGDFVEPPTQSSAFPLFRRAVTPTITSHVTDYDKKYTEDAHGQEFASNSRVYKVYLEEANKRDMEAIDNWRDNLDVLLIFAGLFSAVVTTFVVEASSSLKPDYAEISVHLQAENNALLRAISSGVSASTVPTSPRSPEQAFVPTYSDVWVNGLWYLSLTLALSVAFITVLVKQWLKYYASFIPGSPQDRARLIEARRRAAGFWRLTAIVGMLLILMHAAVFLFLAGLALLLSTQNTIISSVIISVICTTALFYGVTTILPIFFPHCCYVTPLTLFLYTLWRSARTLWSAITSYCEHIAKKSLSAGHRGRSKFKHSRSASSKLKQRLREVVTWHPMSHAERLTALKDVDLADVHILRWLRSSASLNPSVPPIICEAIAGIREGFTHLSAIRHLSDLIIGDWEWEMAHLMKASRFSQVERYLRMNAVLYTLDTNLSILRHHPSYISVICQAAIRDDEMLRIFEATQMTCCGHSFHGIQNFDYSCSIHALLLICTMGLENSVAADAPKARLHPGAWVNIFAYIIEIARVHPATGGVSETNIRCIQEHADFILRATLSHYYDRTQGNQPYFSEQRSDQNGTKSRVDGPITILEIPPGHCRTRLLQFLYVCSKPTPEHNFNLYIGYPSFVGNMMLLWHKTLLLHLKQYETEAFPVNSAGVLQELGGVLRTSISKDPGLGQITPSPRWNILRRKQSALEPEVREWIQVYNSQLKKALIGATLSVLMPNARRQTQPAVPRPADVNSFLYPRSSTPESVAAYSSLPSDAALSPQPSNLSPNNTYQVGVRNPVIGVQLVSLIQSLQRDRLAKSMPALNIAAAEFPTRELEDMGEKLLREILRMALEDSRNVALGDRLGVHPPDLPRYDQDSNNTGFVLIASIKPSPMTATPVELNRFLEAGSDIFLLIDGVDIVYQAINGPNDHMLNMKRAQLFKIFGATQLITSFIEGILGMEDREDSAGREYLGKPDTLNKCCKIMVQSEFAMFTLDVDSQLDDVSHYVPLSKLRSTNRSNLEKWWKEILKLTKDYPDDFRAAWDYVFKNKVVYPCRPIDSHTTHSAPTGKASTELFSPVVPHGRTKEPTLTVALHKKHHYLWIEQIKEALKIDEQEYPHFKLSVTVTQEVYDNLPSSLRRRHPSGIATNGFIHVKFDLIKDLLNENMNTVEETGGSELGKLLIPLLQASMRWPAHNQNRVDIEAEQGIALPT